MLKLAHKNFSKISDTKGGGTNFSSLGWGKKRGRNSNFSKIKGGNQTVPYCGHCLCLVKIVMLVSLEIDLDQSLLVVIYTEAYLNLFPLGLFIHCDVWKEWCTFAIVVTLIKALFTECQMFKFWTSYFSIVRFDEKWCLKIGF